MKIRFSPLEVLSPSFAHTLRQWRNSEKVRSQMLHQKEVSEDEHMKWYHKVTAETSSYRVRVAFADEVPFGAIYLTDIDLNSYTASWGMYIGENRFLGHGLGKYLLASLLFWGFEELSLFRMYTSVVEGNDLALILYQKAGFRIEGVWRQHAVCRNGRKDLLWIGMLRDEWESQKEQVSEWVLRAGE